MHLKIIPILILISSFLLSCNKEPVVIHKVYLKSGSESTILYDTEDSIGEVLIEDSLLIFTIEEVSQNKNWVSLLQISSNPSVNHGMTEKYRLFYIPLKKEVNLSDPILKKLSGVESFGTGAFNIMIKQRNQYDVLEYSAVGKEDVTIKLSVIADGLF